MTAKKDSIEFNSQIDSLMITSFFSSVRAFPSPIAAKYSTKFQSPFTTKPDKMKIAAKHDAQQNVSVPVTFHAIRVSFTKIHSHKIEQWVNLLINYYRRFQCIYTHYTVLLITLLLIPFYCSFYHFMFYNCNISCNPTNYVMGIPPV